MVSTFEGIVISWHCCHSPSDHVGADYWPSQSKDFARLVSRILCNARGSMAVQFTLSATDEGFGGTIHIIRVGVWAPGKSGPEVQPLSRRSKVATNDLVKEKLLHYIKCGSDEGHQSNSRQMQVLTSFKSLQGLTLGWLPLRGMVS